MSIAKMKKLSLIGLGSERTEIVRRLQRLGCAEISEPAEGLQSIAQAQSGPSARFDTLRLADSVIQRSFEVLDKHAPEKGKLFSPKPRFAVDELMSAEGIHPGVDAAEKIVDLDGRIKKHDAEIQRLLLRIATLTPWKDLDMSLDFPGTENVATAFCTFPKDADMNEASASLKEAAPESELLSVSEDKSVRYTLLICWKSEMPLAQTALRDFSFSEVFLPSAAVTPAEEIANCEREIEHLKQLDKEILEEIVRMSDNRDTMKLSSDKISTRMREAVDLRKLLNTEKTFMLSGWVPEADCDKVRSVLDCYTVDIKFEDPAPDEYPEVPIKLENGFLSRSLNFVTDMYSYPTYDGVDPNPLMAPFFIVFFGMMMGDMAYGLIMIAGFFLMTRKMKVTGSARTLAELLLWCGISSFIWGALTGGFFGDFIPQLLRIINPASTFELPSLFSPLSDTVMVLVGSLAMGLIQTLTGMAISMAMKIRDGDVKSAIFEEGAWYVIMAGIALKVLKGSNIMLYAGLAMLAFGCFISNKGFAKISSLFGALYNGISGYFSDILSYSRLMALMLAGSVVAQVFNTLGAITGNVIGFFIIALVGNILNLVLNLLSCYVHDMRLQCLEFFGRFYKEGGRPFDPLYVSAKYSSIGDCNK